MGEITDPSILAILEAEGGSKGGGPSATDKKDYGEAMRNASDARKGMFAYAKLLPIAARYPGGFPQNVLDAGKTKVGSTDQAALDYTLFNAMAKRAAIGQSAALKPVSNTDIGLLIESGANPAMRYRGGNRDLINQDYQSTARGFAENTLRQKWIEKHGSLSAAAPNGKTFTQAMGIMYNDPRFKANAGPLTDVVTNYNKQFRKPGKQAAATSLKQKYGLED